MTGAIISAVRNTRHFCKSRASGCVGLVLPKPSARVFECPEFDGTFRTNELSLRWSLSGKADKQSV